jgi:hypothetical protein
MAKYATHVLHVWCFFNVCYMCFTCVYPTYVLYTCNVCVGHTPVLHMYFYTYVTYIKIPYLIYTCGMFPSVNQCDFDQNAN